MLLETLTGKFRKLRATNTTDNGFPTRVPTITKPSGTGNSAAQATASSVFDLGQEGEYVQNSIMVAFYGVGSDTNTFSCRFLHWRVLPNYAPAGADSPLWIPIPLFEVAVALSTPTGATGGVLPTTERFADTITITGTTANAGVSIDVVSPANDTIAHLIIDFKGGMLLEPIFTTGASATSCNGVMAML